MPSVEASPAYTGPDSRMILVRFENDRSLLADVLEVFLETCPAMLSQIRQAISSRNPKSLFVAAHSFKGAASNFCIDRAVDLAARLEYMAADEDLGDLKDAGRLGERLDKEMSRVTPLLQNLLQETLLHETVPCTF